MTYLRLPYDDASDTTEMLTDCAEAGRTMQRVGRHPDPGSDAVRRAASFGPVVVPDGLAEMAAGMQLHFD